jgi:hypothetical protein
MKAVAAVKFEPVSMRPSDWARYALRIPVKGDMQRFSFFRREYLIQIYDRPDPKLLLMIGRQSEKSTTQGNRMLSLACMLPHYKCLYVSPSQTQTRKFSQDRIAQPMAFSKTLRELVEPMPVNNVHAKEFSNGSSIELRYANRSADRVRGVPADYLAIDEFQDMLIDNVPVLEETTSHSDLPDYSGWTAYSFTPKSLDNTGSYYWDKSTQTELLIPCERHGLPSVPSTWYWNIIGEENIGPEGLICSKCKKPIDRWHQMRGWRDQVKNALFRGYRVPQMLTPSVQDHQWYAKVWFKYKTYPRPKFFNEVMAIPFESGMRPLSKWDIIQCCNPDWTMSHSQLKEASKWFSSREIFAGVDYGTAEHAWTVVALGTYITPAKFTIFYLHRFTGNESDPNQQGPMLGNLFDMFKVKVSFGDMGMGYAQNHFLQAKFGVNKHHILAYVAEAKRRIYWNPSKVKWIGVRDELMAALVNAIREGKIQFPAWPAFETFGQDILNITTEFNETRQRTQFRHHPEKPDDTFHAILYCLLAASLVTPRPDIFLSIPKP